MPKPSRFQANPDTKTRELRAAGFRLREGAGTFSPVRRPALPENSSVRRQLLNWDWARQDIAADVAAAAVKDGEVASERALSEASKSYQPSFESEEEAGDANAELTESEDDLSYQQFSQVKAAIMRATDQQEIDEVKDALRTGPDWTSMPWWIRQGPTMTQYRWDMEHQPSANWLELAGLSPTRRNEDVIQPARQPKVEDNETDQPEEQSKGLPTLPTVPPPPPLRGALPALKFGPNSSPEGSDSEEAEAIGQERMSVPLARFRDARRLGRQQHRQGAASLPSLAHSEHRAEVTRTAARRAMRTSKSVSLAIDSRIQKETTDLMSRTGAFGRIMEANVGAMAQVSWSLPQVRRSEGTALRARI